jgi:hypothetical protein
MYKEKLTMKRKWSKTFCFRKYYLETEEPCILSATMQCNALIPILVISTNTAKTVDVNIYITSTNVPYYQYVFDQPVTKEFKLELKFPSRSFVGVTITSGCAKFMEELLVKNCY